MLQDLAALAGPAIVAGGFLVGVWVLVRRELAPRRRARAQAPSAAAADDPVREPAEREPADREQGGS